MDRNANDDLKKELGANIRCYRALADMTQAKLAETIGVAQCYVAEYETGKRFPNLVTAMKMAQALGTSMEALFANTAVRRIPNADADYCIAQFKRLEIPAVYRKHKILVTIGGKEYPLTISEATRCIRENRTVLRPLLKKAIVYDIVEGASRKGE